MSYVIAVCAIRLQRNVFSMKNANQPMPTPSTLRAPQRTPPCPQCSSMEFVTIGNGLSRCTRCRWLVRYDDARGTFKTAFDVSATQKRKRATTHRRAFGAKGAR